MTLLYVEQKCIMIVDFRVVIIVEYCHVVGL